MRSPACRVCVLLALVLSLGLHWTVLQSAAWVGMVVSYAKDATIGEALQKTFDGEHPCPLCKKIEAGVKKEQDKSKQSKTEKTVKMELMTVAMSEVAIIPATPSKREFVSSGPLAAVREHAPPVPPPRRA